MCIDGHNSLPNTAAPLLKDPLMAKFRGKKTLPERTTGDELRERERKRERDPKNCASVLITACLDSDDNISASMHTLENA